MTVLTPAQAYTLARQGGFDPVTAVIMVAIGGAESGLRTDAKGDVGLEDATWGPSVGPLQIRSLKADLGTGRARDASRLTDPAFNFRSGFSIFKSQGLNAWSTFTSGAFRNFMPGAQKAGAAGGAALPPGGVTASNAAATSAQNIDFNSNWNPLNWPGNVLEYGAGVIATPGSDAALSIWSQVRPVMWMALFTGLGLGLVAIGSFVVTAPVRHPDLAGLVGGSK
jgi:hypothetical protein